MRKPMSLISKMMVYFFTPEDSSGLASRGTIALGTESFGLGSVKALFWVLMTLGGFYLTTLI